MMRKKCEIYWVISCKGNSLLLLSVSKTNFVFLSVWLYWCCFQAILMKVTDMVQRLWSYQHISHAAFRCLTASTL